MMKSFALIIFSIWLALPAGAQEGRAGEITRVIEEAERSFVLFRASGELNHFLDAFVALRELLEAPDIGIVRIAHRENPRQSAGLVIVGLVREMVEVSPPGNMEWLNIETAAWIEDLPRTIETVGLDEAAHQSWRYIFGGHGYRVLKYIGDRYAEIGELAMAATYYEQAIAIAPDHFWVGYEERSRLYALWNALGRMYQLTEPAALRGLISRVRESRWGGVMSESVDSVLTGFDIAAWQWALLENDLFGTEPVYTFLRLRGRDGNGSQYIEFRVVQPGTFWMGSPMYERGRDSDERQEQVTLTQGYEIQTTEVTQLQWFLVMGNNPSEFDDQHTCPNDYVEIDGIGLCPNHPVERVRRDDAQAYLQRLNDLDPDHTYRLPTGAEWEYAARGGTRTPYFFRAEESEDYAWFRSNSENHTHKVAGLFPNDWGIYDMSGNVGEWVSDTRGAARLRDDMMGTFPRGYCNIRGGGFNSGLPELRSASFWRCFAFDRCSIGFRVVRTRSAD